MFLKYVVMPGQISSLISTRFLVMSDTYNFECEENQSIFSPLCLPLPKVDVLLHYDDLIHCSGLSSYRKVLKMLGSMKLIIAGIRDQEFDKQYWNTHRDEGDESEDHQRAVDIRTGCLAA